MEQPTLKWDSINIGQPINEIFNINGPSNILNGETYDTYRIHIGRQASRGKHTTWIFDIFNGYRDGETVLFEDQNILILANNRWKNASINNMALLVFAKDPALRTIRDLDGSHIPLLNHMRDKAFTVIKEKYGLKQRQVVAFFHYPPSTYQLHAHFVSTQRTETTDSSKHNHSLDMVIASLEAYHDYYKKINMPTYRA